MWKRTVMWMQESLVHAIFVAMPIPAIISLAFVFFVFNRQSTDALTAQMETNLQQLVAARAAELDLRARFSPDTSRSQLIETALDIHVLEGAGYGFLLDDTATIVAHPTAQAGWEIEDVLGADSADFHRRIRHMIDGNSGLGSFRTVEGRVLLAYAPVDEMGWSLGIIVPYEEVLAPVTAMRRRVLLFAGMLPVLVGVPVWVLARLVHRPLLQLLDGVRQVSERGRADPIEIRSFREIQQVAQAFNQMAARVFEREAALRKRNARLRIEIDAQKRRKQVDSIVETDFFRRLELNAARLREQVHNPAGGATDQIS